jgi:PII-like signaling protein
MTIYIGDADRSHHTSVAKEIVHRAHHHGLAGASVLHGIEGFGANSRIHTDRFSDIAEDLPMVIVIIDDDEKIRAFLPELDDLIVEGLVTLDPVDVVRYVGGATTP